MAQRKINIAGGVLCLNDEIEEWYVEVAPEATVGKALVEVDQLGYEAIDPFEEDLEAEYLPDGTIRIYILPKEVE